MRLRMFVVAVVLAVGLTVVLARPASAECLIEWMGECLLWNPVP